MLGLALEGGGAKGAFHMGVVKAFRDEGLEFGGVTGTSIGALNGAIIAQGDFEAGYQLWQNITPSRLFNIDEAEYQKLVNLKIDKETALQAISKVTQFIRNKGVSTEKIKELLETIIDEEKLRKSTTDFGLVTVSLSDLKPIELYKEDIPPGKVVDYLMASANFPGFQLRKIESKYYIDGGFYDNCPINLLAAKGYREIIAVRTFGIGMQQEIKYPDVKVTHIYPSENLGRMMDFSNDLSNRNLLMGYYDAVRKIKRLKGFKYCIEPIDGRVLSYALMAMPDESIITLGKSLGIETCDPGRMLFEKIMPKLAEMLGLNSLASHLDIVVGLLETLAAEKGVPKYKIYSFGGFIEAIHQSNRNDSAALPDIPLIRILQLSGKIPRKQLLRNVATRLFHEISGRRL